MEKKRWDCTALPKGWKMEEVTRKSGLSAGKSDVYYFRYLTNEGLVFNKWMHGIRRGCGRKQNGV